MSASTGAPADFARALGSHDLMKGTAADDDPAADDRRRRRQEPAAALVYDCRSPSGSPVLAMSHDRVCGPKIVLV